MQRVRLKNIALENIALGDARFATCYAWSKQGKPRRFSNSKIGTKMQRVRLKNIALGDPDDVEIYAMVAVGNWLQTENGKRIVEQYGITADKMYWTNGPVQPHSITVDIWAEVDKETEILLNLSGLLQVK